MTMSKIKELVSSAFQAGRIDVMIEMGVRADKVRRKEAEQNLTMKGFKKCTLDKWISDRLITEYVGECKNSPRLYSLSEINEVVLSATIKNII